MYLFAILIDFSLSKSLLPSPLFPICIPPQPPPKRAKHPGNLNVCNKKQHFPL